MTTLSTTLLMEELEARRAAVVFEYADSSLDREVCPAPSGHAFLSEPDMAALTYDEPDAPRTVQAGRAVVVTVGCVKCGTVRIESYCDGELLTQNYEVFGWLEKVTACANSTSATLTPPHARRPTWSLLRVGPIRASSSTR